MSNAILLVEDNEDDVVFLKRALEKAEVANPVKVVGNGLEAKEYLNGEGEFGDRERFPFPSIVLLDQRLPKLNALEVLKWIRSHRDFQSLVVIMLTASQDDGDIVKAYKAGANSFLVKTASPEKLTAMARSIRDFWLTFNLVPELQMPESVLA